MDALPQAGMIAHVVGGILGQAPDTSPNYRCPKCQTEVRTPASPLSIDLESHRETCADSVAEMQEAKSLGEGGLWTEEAQNYLDQRERFVRILDSMTPEDRLGPELPGPARRAQLAAASGTSPDDVEKLFGEFAESQQKAQASKVRWWQGIVGVAILLGIGATAVSVELTGVAAAIVSGLGYYFLCFLCVLVVVACFLRLTRTGRRLLMFERPRKALFVLVLLVLLLPGLLAFGVVALVHEHVLRAGWESSTVHFGFISLGVLLFMTWIAILATYQGRQDRQRPQRGDAGGDGM
jgi:hypothetical protein